MRLSWFGERQGWIVCALVAALAVFGAVGAAYADAEEVQVPEGEASAADAEQVAGAEDAVDVGAEQSIDAENVARAEGEQTLSPGEPVYPGAQIVAGETQYDTSAMQALQAFPEGASVAIVASGVIPVDALAASSLAGALECPIMLTAKEYVPESVAAAVSELGVTDIVIVGGPAVVGEAVEQAFVLGGYQVERLYGDSQYDTQMEIYRYGEERGYWDESDTLIVASGIAVSAADALSASPVAYKLKAPVILVDSKGRMSVDAMNEFAQSTRYTRALIVGGTAVVSDTVQGYMSALTMFNGGSSNALRLAGQTLYDTSAEVAKWAVQQGVLQWDGLAFATGKTPFDSLGGSAVQGRAGAVLLLVDPGYRAGLEAAIPYAESISSVKFFGGEAVMPSSVRSDVCEALLVAEDNEQEGSGGEEGDEHEGEAGGGAESGSDGGAVDEGSEDDENSVVGEDPEDGASEGPDADENGEEGDVEGGVE